MTIMAQDDRGVKRHPGSIGHAVGISAEAQAALGDLSAIMQRAVARMQEKRATVERMVSEAAPSVEERHDEQERPAGLRAVR